jgi:hypothetical protein
MGRFDFTLLSYDTFNSFLSLKLFSFLNLLLFSFFLIISCNVCSNSCKEGVFSLRISLPRDFNKSSNVSLGMLCSPTSSNFLFEVLSNSFVRG